jgi:Ras-related GTP-binding protein C/D
MGPPRSGKTSILRVLFGKLSPHDTSFLEPTTAPSGLVYPSPTPNSSKEALLRCRIIDLPGSPQFHRQFQPLITKLLSAAACVVFVIDASAESTWHDATTSLLQLLTAMDSLDIQRHVAVLLHKIDGEAYLGSEMTPQYTELRRGLLDALRANSIKLPVTFYVTSLFDVTIYESFSRIFQQIIPQTNLLGTLLDGFITACGIEKVFIVDTNSRLYLATDSTAPDVTLYQLLGDMLDLVFDIGFVYSPSQDYDEDENGEQAQIDNQNQRMGDISMAMNALNQFGASSLTQPLSFQQNGNNGEHGTGGPNGSGDGKEKDSESDFDSYASEIILQNNVHLFLRQLNSHLSLLFSLQPNEGVGSNPITNRKGTIEYNVTCLKQAISSLFNLNIHGVQNRPQLYNNLSSGASGSMNPGDYGINHYMGSYASQSAIANLKSSYYSHLAGGQSYIAAGSVLGGHSMIPQANNPNRLAHIAGSSRTPSNFAPDGQPQQNTGSMPNQQRGGR